MSQQNWGFEGQSGALRKVGETTPAIVMNVAVAASLGGKQALLMYVHGAPGTYAVASESGNANGPMALQFAKGCIGVDTNAGTLFMNSNASAPSWTAQV